MILKGLKNSILQTYQMMKSLSFNNKCYQTKNVKTAFKLTIKSKINNKKIKTKLQV